MDKAIEWRKNPQGFMRAAWPDIFLWSKLEEVCKAIVENKQVIVPSGHGTGKTFIAARLALWFLFCFYPSKVITTAPTWPQVEKLLWSEITKAYNTAKFPLGGRLLQTELKVEEDWFATGFSTRGRADEREFGTPKFQGYHSPNLLLIADEAPGVDHQIWVSFSGLLTASNNKLMALGNPTSPSGDFFEACKSPAWKKVIISCFDHPNVTRNEIVVPGAVTREWIEARKLEWGEGSSLYMTKVLGQFPTEGTDTIVPLSWAEACVGLKFEPKKDDKGNPLPWPVRIGIDVARYGADKTVFAKMVGPTLLPLETYAKQDTNFTIGRATILNREMSPEIIAVDDSGVGGGVTDGLEAANVEVNPINNGSSAIESDKFENRGSELWWNMREAIQRKEISLPDDTDLINQISSRKYHITRKGKIMVESKDDMKKRGLPSPDKGDALALALSATAVKDAPTISIISVQDEDDQ